jgi:hypothetical protein
MLLGSEASLYYHVTYWPGHLIRTEWKNSKQKALEHLEHLVGTCLSFLAVVIESTSLGVLLIELKEALS